METGRTERDQEITRSTSQNLIVPLSDVCLPDTGVWALLAVRQ